MLWISLRRKCCLASQQRQEEGGGVISRARNWQTLHGVLGHLGHDSALVADEDFQSHQEVGQRSAGEEKCQETFNKFVMISITAQLSKFSYNL